MEFSTVSQLLSSGPFQSFGSQSRAPFLLRRSELLPDKAACESDSSRQAADARVGNAGIVGQVLAGLLIFDK